MRKKTDPEYTNVIKIIFDEFKIIFDVKKLIFDEFYSLTIEVLLYRNKCENENNSGNIDVAGGC